MSKYLPESTPEVLSVPEVLDADTADFNQQLEFIDSSIQSVNVLDQLPSYNYVDTEIFIGNVSKELDQQKIINELLLSNEEIVKSHVEKVKAFADVNASKVADQLQQLKSIATQLKDIVGQNVSLKEKFTEVNELSTNEKYVALAKNIQDIKKQKQDILDFLKNFGIIAPPLSV
jgi:hypothetical protein